MPYVLPLAEVGLAEAGRIGRKAAVLGELRAAGFAVPAGFVITADAADAAPAVLEAEVAAALGTLGPGPVAVRSSGVDEDLPDQSYAGQYESVLDVRGLDAVLAAIGTCRASAATDRVSAYRGDQPGPARLGVLVQVMVEATAAGVAFSANPVTGDRNQTVINAVSGLAPRLVAGEVDAEEWSVRGDNAVRVPARGTGRPALSVAEARAVARLAQEIAEHAGVPQDIEWAMDGTRLWLLQARPITALPDQPVEPVPIDIVVPAGSSTRNRAMDRPWTPLERSVFLPVFSATVRHIFAFTTGVSPTAHSIGGWVYITTRPDDASQRPRQAIAADVAADVPQALLRSWYDEWKPAFAKEIDELRAVDVSGLADPALADHLGLIVELFGRLHERYFQLTGAAIAVGMGLTSACGHLLGWSPAQTARLRGGLAGDHMAATVGLSDLARLAASLPAVRAYLDDPGAHPDRLPALDPRFAAAFADYVARYGHRTIGFDLTEPTLAEQPAVLLALIRAQLDQPYDFVAERAAIEARIAAARDEALAVLAGASDADRERFERAAAAVALSSPVRDEKVFQAVFVWALLRAAALELGGRLVARGAADRADDALFLELPEALAALSNHDDQRALIRHHRGQHAWALANPGPPSYGDPPPPSGLAAGPAGDLAIPDGELRGLAASPGRYVGPARIIRSVTEFGKLRRGDVLVCPETTAQWSMLFPSVGALVTDHGTLLSHPAIIAREYAIPAVVATNTATSALRDGELVLVDGSAGEVRPVSDALTVTNTARARHPA